MSLPKHPELNEPIPNEDVPNNPRQYSMKGPYWDMLIGDNLEIGADGELTYPDGIGEGNSSVILSGTWWPMGIGTGLGIDANGNLQISTPCDYPPYGCSTNVNPFCVTNFNYVTGALNACTDYCAQPAVYTGGTIIPGQANNSYDASMNGGSGSGGTLYLERGAGGEIVYVEVYSGSGYEIGDYLTVLGSDIGGVDGTDDIHFLLSANQNIGIMGAWAGCNSLTSFPLLDVSSGTQFNAAWSNCTSLTSFPLLNVSSGTNFYAAWFSCTSLTSFPLLDVSSGTNFYAAWANCTSLTSFPLLDVSSGTNFTSAWANCNSLTSFPLLDVSNGTNFNYAWQNCTSLTTFPAGMFDTCTATNFANAWSNCALDETSVDNILVSLDTAGQSNGTLGINGGTSAAPGAAGAAAKASLIAKGWSVTTN